jgi:hypothetical protein
VAALLFGVLVYHKQVHLGQGDQGVFYRAGWSIRQGGADLYTTRDDHHWHYHYPPLFAILMVPLADPPPGTPDEEQTWLLPEWVKVVLLYSLNLACLFLAVRLLAGCLAPERGHLIADAAGRRLHLLVWPVVVCLPAIGITLARGQVDLLLLLLLAAFTAGLVHGRRFAAGLCLAGAICIKVIPAFLLLLPLWRRDGRCLVGCAAGLFVGLWLVPALVVGPGRTAELYATQFDVLLKPGLGLSEHGVRGPELLDARGTVNQSFQMVLHLTRHYGEPRAPAQPAGWARAVGWLVTAALTALVLRRHGRAQGKGLVLLVGLLTVIMVLASPVCHLHYLTLVVPLAAAVVDHVLEGDAPWACWVALVLPGVGCTAFMLPGLRPLRELGLPLYTTLALWTAGLLSGRLNPSSGKGTICWSGLPGGQVCSRVR